METESHYFKVGLFFIAALAAAAYYAVAFGGRGEKHELKRYAVYFNRSVSGLERGAPVKLQGITVGQVGGISFVSTGSDRIRVMADIDAVAPVRTDTVATVAFQGITGATYLSLENTGPDTGPQPLMAQNGERWPVIASRPSDVQSLLTGAPALMGRLSETIGQAQKLLSDRNVANAGLLLPEAQETLAEATAAFREIKMLARELRDDPSLILHGPQYQGYRVPRQ
ncbi:MAG: MCE family protein [Alphaproteobacteria bacterium]|nr:MCE family protein [Alphaproteobacteria bacterium]